MQNPRRSVVFATSHGLVRIDPNNMPRRHSSPRVFIERLRFGTNTIDYFQGPDSPADLTFRLPPGSGRSLDIEFTALNYAAPTRSTFRYRLEGVDNEWQNAGTRRIVSYANLDPRSYRLEVQVAGRDGRWNTNSSSIAFAIAPLFSESRWFHFSLATATTGILLFFILWRLREMRCRHRLEIASRLASERDRMARDLHDDLAADLTRIVLSKPGQSDNAPATIARGAIDKLGELIWAADPNFDTLSDLTAYLRQRVSQLGGTLSIESSAHRGTIISVRVPLPRPIE